MLCSAMINHSAHSVGTTITAHLCIKLWWTQQGFGGHSKS